jgi:hypothetical protein
MPLYSDMNGFPEVGFPILGDVGDRLCLNTLYWSPLKPSGYVIDMVGASRLGTVLITAAGAVSGITTLGIGGALSGATTIAANNTVTLSSATAPLTLSGANAVLSITGLSAVLSMTGLNASIGTFLSRIRRAWFTDLDVTNTPTVLGEPVALIKDIQQVLKANTITLGGGTAGTDYTLTIDGESNDGVIKWMEDEDYFTFSDDIHFGDGTNYANFSDTLGTITWGGSFLKKLTLRPNLIDTRTKVSDNKPTETLRGCNQGYSFPVYAADDEELYFKQRIPIRWDGTTDPQFGMCVTLAAGEDVGDKFKFQLEWQTTAAGNVMGDTTSNCTSEQVVLTGRNDAHDTYFVFFNLDASDATNPIEVGSMLQARLRRIASAAPAITGEVVVWDWATMWAVNNVYGAWSVETNAT